MSEHISNISDEYEITQSQLEQYRTQGHLFLPAVAKPSEFEACRMQLMEIITPLLSQCKPFDERDVYRKSFLQVNNVWIKNNAIREFVTSRHFAKIAADLMGVDKVRLYYDCALIKESGGGHTPLHLDPFVVDTEHIVTMWMPFIDIPAELGSLHFITGSHRYANVNKTPIQIINEAVRDRLNSMSYGAIKAGDATFHSGWMIHSAPPNRTDIMRVVMTVTYYADPARLLDPKDNSIRKDHLVQYLNGGIPGELAGGPLNPIVYDRGEHF
jgi:hypothetical protein